MAKEPVTADAAPKKGGGVMRLLKLLLGSAVLVGAGFGGGYFYFANPLSPAQDMLRLIDPAEEAAAEADAHATEGEGEAAPKKLPKPVPEQELFVTSYYSFPDPLTSNLKDSRRFLQVQVGVSTQYDAQVITNVTTHTPALMSDMLAVISTFTEEDLAGTEGRAKLAAALMAAINKRLEKAEGFGGIEDVFFPSFVLQ
jgi:flagellar FliL protein